MATFEHQSVSISAVASLLLAAIALSVNAKVAAAQHENTSTSASNEIVRTRAVDLDVAALAAGAEIVHLPLFPDRTFSARRERRDLVAGGSVWVGRIVGAESGHATFALHDGVLSGFVQVGTEVYQLRAAVGGAVIVDEIDASRLPGCTPPVVPLPSAPSSVALAPNAPASTATSGAHVALTTTPPTIDVLVVYTRAARAAEGGTAAMEAFVDMAVAVTNQAYTDSSVVQRMRLVGRAELTGYTETNDFTTELGRLTQPNDGWLDNVGAMRDACGADVVCMIIESVASCGVANQMQTADVAFAPYAFAVTARNCAVANFTFAHELGHVMGLTHDRDNATRKCSRASVSGLFVQDSGPSTAPATSYNGSLVAFTSSATDLVAGDVNGFTDVFVRDRGGVTTRLVSVTTSGVQGNGPSRGLPAISAGRYVVFASDATNLVPGDTNGVTDIFVRDLSGPVTFRVQPAAGNTQADGRSYEPGISGDERWITFTSDAPNLGASTSAPQVFRWDRSTTALALVSATSGGTASNATSGGAVPSDGGQFVAFWSDATDLVLGDTNGVRDVFVRNVSAGTTERVSLSASGAQISGACEPFTAISANGRYVLFATAASDVVLGDVNGATDLFVRDRTLGVTLLVSANLSGAPGNGASAQNSAASISDDGTLVAFASLASDLVLNDTNGASDVFVRNLTTATTDRVSVTSGGAEMALGGGSGAPVSIAGNGLVVSFVSSAPLEVGDTNNVADIYAFDRTEPYPQGVATYAYGYRTSDQLWRTIMAYQPGTRLPFFSNPAVVYAGEALGVASPSPFAAESWRALNDTGPTVAAFRAALYTEYCFGDGSGTACPCGNASAVGDQAGCLNSLGLAGRLEALGSPSLASDSVLLRASSMPNSSALFFQGTTQVNGGAGAPFGDGLRCAGGSIQRLGVRVNASGASSLPNAGDPLLSVLGHVTIAATHTYQVWYRNSAAFCSASTFNLTNGLSVSWQP